MKAQKAGSTQDMKREKRGDLTLFEVQKYCHDHRCSECGFAREVKNIPPPCDGRRYTEVKGWTCILEVSPGAWSQNDLNEEVPL